MSKKYLNASRFLIWDIGFSETNERIIISKEYIINVNEHNGDVALGFEGKEWILSEANSE